MQRDCPGQSSRQQAAGSGQRNGQIRALILCCLPPVACCLLSAGGCQKTKSTGPVAPAQRWANVTLTVACPDGEPRLLIERAGAAWARQTGATIRCISPSADAAADVVVLRAAEMPQW